MKTLINEQFLSIEQSALNKMINLMQNIDFKSFNAIDLQKDGGLIKVINNIAIIPINGVMAQNPSFIERFFLGFTSTNEIKEAVNVAANDKSIDVIILSVNSPGGFVGGIKELSDAVFAAKENNKVYAVVSGTCCSAAYWVASQAEKIYCTSIHDNVGSIGVRTTIFDSKEYYEKAGIKVHAIDTGKFKSLGESGTEITEEHLNYLQSSVDSIFEDFLLDIVRGRCATHEEAIAVGDGKVFLAKEAALKGLIDGKKNISDIISENIIVDNRVNIMRAKAKAAVAISKTKIEV